jgi:hypothetical protein
VLVFRKEDVAITAILSNVTSVFGVQTRPEEDHVSDKEVREQNVSTLEDHGNTQLDITTMYNVKLEQDACTIQTREELFAQFSVIKLLAVLALMLSNANLD